MPCHIEIVQWWASSGEFLGLIWAFDQFSGWKGSNGMERDVCCGEMSKIHPATRVHFRKETGQRLTASAFVDEIDSFDDTTVFLLEGNVVVELDQNE